MAAIDRAPRVYKILKEFENRNDVIRVDLGHLLLSVEVPENNHTGKLMFYHESDYRATPNCPKCASALHQDADLFRHHRRSPTGQDSPPSEV
jgi:hypothetical protein